jgi:Integrase core domain
MLEIVPSKRTAHPSCHRLPIEAARAAVHAQGVFDWQIEQTRGGVCPLCLAARPAARYHPSMGSVGDALDNAMTESFFATLECELLDRHRLQTRTQAPMAVFDYPEGFDNPRRRHSALGYLSPIEYERSHQHRSRAAHRPPDQVNSR